MVSDIASFLHFGFKGLFRDYNRSWVDVATLAFSQSLELIRSDVLVSNPKLLQSVDFDFELAMEMEVNAALTASVLYRIERQIFLSDPLHSALTPLAHFMRVRTGIELYYSTEIGPRFCVVHGSGLVLGPRNKIGSDFTICQGVTLGLRYSDSVQDCITIGNHVTVFSGAKLLGTIAVGDGVTVAANAVLLTDAEPGSTYAGIPAKRI